MIELQDIFAEGKAYRESVFELYEEAFPEEEKKPQELLIKLVEAGMMEILAVTEDSEFIGLAMNMMYGQSALLDYFAIASSKRNSGYGGRTIRQLLERFADRKYIFEIEMQDPSADNALERRRRKNFYLRNGLKETGVFANVYYTDFELLTPDGELTYEAYFKVLNDILGPEQVARVNPHEIEGPGSGA